jgi:hypothetical protein
MEITESRKKVYLEVLRRTGSKRAAARAASPHADGAEGARSSFRALERRDPTWALAVRAALDDAVGLVEETIAERAVEGVDEPVYQKGELVGFRKVYSDTLLLRLAARLAPEAWSERQRTELSGSVGVRPEDGAFLSISAQDVLLLSAPKQRQLADLVEEVGRLKEGDDGRSIQKLPAPAESDVGGPARP